VPGAGVREFRRSLSALLLVDDDSTLFLGCDETVGRTPSIERLQRRDDGFASHTSFAVSDFIDLPDPQEDKGRVGEIDIEGLDEHGGYLWLTGSHCCNRKAPQMDAPLKKQIERLARVERGANRFLLGRIPLQKDGTTTTLARRHDGRQAGRLTTSLVKELARDPHLGPYLQRFDGEDVFLPGKDNGLDVEGLSVGEREDGSVRLLLGLRGPVLRGYAIVLELCPAGEGELELEPFPGSRGALYRKHFLDLDGLGIRDLGFFAEDLWILAGPTMVLRAPATLFRWHAPFPIVEKGDSLTRMGGGRLTREVTLPPPNGREYPESFGLLRPSEGPFREVLVIHDTPAEERLVGDLGLLADVVALP